LAPTMSSEHAATTAMALSRERIRMVKPPGLSRCSGLATCASAASDSLAHALSYVPLNRHRSSRF
jgi:hypothetical protein